MNAARTITVVAAATVYTLAGAATASADQVKYIGVHPIDAGGFCHIEAPHVHVFAPSKKKNKRKLLYRVHDGQYHFVGDPVAHGYDGPKVAYYGHHPIAVDVVAGVHVEGEPAEVELCYLDGPHYHWYEPPPALSFELKGDTYWFTGEYPAEYKRHRKELVRINAVYRPIEYSRPVIEIEPPVAYVGPVVEVHDHGHRPAVRAAVGVGVEVRAPVVEVRAPRLEIGIGVPGVVVHDHHEHVVEVHHHKRHKVKRKHYRKGHKQKRHKRGRRHH